jgi:hypothetical protein
MAALFGVLCVMVMIWSALRYQFASRSLIDSLPPQFQDDLTSRYAFSVYVLEPSSPLPLQAEFMSAMWGSCVALLCLSLCFFSLHNILFGCVITAGTVWVVVSTFRSWKIYKANCDRVGRHPEEEP